MKRMHYTDIITLLDRKAKLSKYISLDAFTMSDLNGKISIKPRSITSNGLPAKTLSCGRDKSLTHRAVIFGSMASGHSTIHHALLGADCWATIHAFRALGVSIKVDQTHQTIDIVSNGMAAFTSPQSALDCANSGTTARLLIGLLAGIDGLEVCLIGDESLSKRPMDRVIKPLQAMGASIEANGPKGYMPVKIKGKKLHSAEIEVAKASAQVKSAILLAAANTHGTTSIKLPVGSRDHTERFLRDHGVHCKIEQTETWEKLSITGPIDQLPAIDVAIPVDPSSTAFFAVLCAIHPATKLTLADTLANETRLGYVKVLKRMGLNVTSTPSKTTFIEAAVNLNLYSSQNLLGTKISQSEIPTLIDEIPVLAIAAAFAKSESEFEGLQELRVKESDRLEKTYELLTLAGAEASIKGDKLLIKGGLSVAKPFTFDPANDHRLAMAAAIIATRSSGECQILNPQCVNVSFPGFFDVLTSL